MCNKHPDFLPYSDSGKPKVAVPPDEGNIPKLKLQQGNLFAIQVTLICMYMYIHGKRK